MIGDQIADYMLNQLQSENAIADQIQSGYQYYLIYQSRNCKGYFAILNKHESSDLFLSKLYLLDSQRGKGFGRAAMTFIEILAQKKKCKKISLTVYSLLTSLGENVKAIAACEKWDLKKPVLLCAISPIILLSTILSRKKY